MGANARKPVGLTPATHDDNVVVHDTRTNPDAVLVTRWNSDPDIRGAYSFLRVDGVPSDRDTLASRPHRGIHLAGEFTSRHYPGTMHGAYFSGLRAAREVIDDGARDVIVIGSGLAGLAAARMLHDAGVDTTVLEARQVTGGRVAVDHSLGGPVNTGAAWVHGTVGHPFGDAVGRHWDWRDLPTYLPARSAYVDPLHAADLIRTLDDEIERRRLRLRHDTSVAEMLDGVVAAISTIPDDQAVLKSHLRFCYDDSYAAPQELASARHSTETYHLPGDDVLVDEPLDRRVSDLANGLRVHLATRVRSITAEEGRHTVRTENGKIYTADAIIVAVPVGVLRSGRIRFEPALPSGHLDALAHIDAGPVTKVFARFSRRWWEDDTMVVAGSALFTLWIDVSSLAGAPVLCGFATGPGAVALESMPEDQVRALLSSEFRGIDLANLPTGAVHTATR